MIRDEKISELARKIQVRIDDALDERFRANPKHVASIVTVQTKNGKMTRRVDYPRGDPRNPIEWNELVRKFSVLSQTGLSAKKSRALSVLVRKLETVDDVNKLTAHLSS